MTHSLLEDSVVINFCFAFALQFILTRWRKKEKQHQTTETMLFKNSILVLASLALTTSSSWAFHVPATSTVRPSSTTTLYGGAMDDLSTGTKAYMDLYPEQSTDGGLRLGNIVPDFSCDTTHGPIKSFHEWKKGKVRVLRVCRLLVN